MLNNVKCLSIMQPYVFPYLGYFHLIKGSQHIIFYDDVTYIKGGWINRNKILINGSDHLFTIPLKSASSNKLILNTIPLHKGRFCNKFYKQIKSAYHRAPYYKEIAPLIFNVLEFEYNNIADLAIHSIKAVCKHLDMTLSYTQSSIVSPSTQGMDKTDRLIKITKDLGYTDYINPIGGRDLYEKQYFRSKGVELSFVKSNPIEYPQNHNNFVPNLSIIDVLMFNDIERVKFFLSQYELV